MTATSAETTATAPFVSLGAEPPNPWISRLPVFQSRRVWQPEDSPFQVLGVDVTHRCNMACKNCYIPNRHVPDMDAEWLRAVLVRLPHRTRIRLAGAEATVRRDLPEIIAMVREVGHIPVLLTNGLKLADRAYVRTLKQAGLRTIYLSLNGGFDDDLYEAIDGLRCAGSKAAALDNMIAENIFSTLGTILVRGVNERVVEQIARRIRGVRSVGEYHVRSVGAFGRYMEQVDPYRVDEMRALTERSFGAIAPIPAESTSTCTHGRAGLLIVQITQWPDLGSEDRGRIAPDGTVQPFFEHVLANEGGY